MTGAGEFDKLRNQLLEADIELVLVKISDLGTVKDNPKFRNEVLLHASKWRNLCEARRQGTQDFEALSREENKIRLAIVELIDLVESQNLKSYTRADGIDVFISYRREDGAEVARLICTELSRRNIRTFLDVENLGGGSWNESLLDSIEAAKAVVVILSAGSLLKIENEDDVLRREISHALSLGKKIVPVMMPEFAFPAQNLLPANLFKLQFQNGVNYSHEFFPAMMDKLITYLD